MLVLVLKHKFEMCLLSTFQALSTFSEVSKTTNLSPKHKEHFQQLLVLNLGFQLHQPQFNDCSALLAECLGPIVVGLMTKFSKN